ncbi:MAG: GNAT family N-acetyltransferase [Clostridia bacterium]|nr:GNAT family N-acetyltransferase [Clostridia bacterium]
MSEIAEEGKRYLKSRGVPQWQRGTYPDRALFESDVREGIGFVVAEGASVLAVCALTFAEEPAYRPEALTAGQWQLPEGKPYASVHRVAVAESARGRHVSSFLFSAAAALAKERGACALRADTHPENLVMQGALTRAGFVRCCELILPDGDEQGDPRYGYELLL